MSDPTGARAGRPGSAAEHRLQERLGTVARADRFYDDQVCDRLLPSMVEFVGRMTMLFVATADGGGACDSTLRSGAPGFVAVLDEHRLAYPERPGAGTRANLRANPRVGLLMVDFVEDRIGLHVNGRARLVEDGELRAEHPDLPAVAATDTGAAAPDAWVVVEVEETYVHCRKHIPRLAPTDGTRTPAAEDARRGGDFFGAAALRRSASGPAGRPARPVPAAGARPTPRRRPSGVGRMHRPEEGASRG